ncbi:choice-of-anchor M domain-containing protein [Rothia sp. ZJ1223]|nr:choice-of-anchor M domain-containing protein [Rothia sp. ZJ1223]
MFRKLDMTEKLPYVRSLTVAALVTGMCMPLAAHADDATAAPDASASAEVKSAQEKALEQKISSDEPIASGRVSIDAGHVDMGPKFIDGNWQLMVHDDSTANPVWRMMEDVVLVGKDAAKLPVPDDERYSFVDAAPGSDVYVIPQTEAEGVVWPGWNTQDPAVVEALGRGVTLTLDRVEGPGQLTVYLENGNFSAPQVLWNSNTPESQDIWVEPNTHTHANWVFTAPGAYFVTVTAHATLADGSEVANTQRIQFAIGSQTNPEDVFAQADQLEPLTADSAEAANDSASTPDAAVPAADSSDSAEAVSEERTGISPALIAGIVAVLAVIGGGVALMMRKSAADQRRAQEQIK